MKLFSLDKRIVEKLFNPNLIYTGQRLRVK
nr:MAG TPA: hypothetical protein [Bacteriophage sp.]